MSHILKNEEDNDYLHTFSYENKNWYNRTIKLEKG